MRRILRHALFANALLLVIGLGIAGCQYPKDMNDSLTTIRGGVLHVGVTENPPWVMKRGDEAYGVEPELIRGIAEQLNAEVRWHWGTESQLVRALEQFQVRLVAGGLTQSTPLSKHAALTNAFFTSENRVGFRADIAPPASLKNIEVGVNFVSGLTSKLQAEGAKPRYLDELPHSPIPVAAPTWRLQAYDLTPGPQILSKHKHVMALPKGENAWMLELQRYLNRPHSIAERLTSLVREANL